MHRDPASRDKIKVSLKQDLIALINRDMDGVRSARLDWAKIVDLADRLKVAPLVFNSVEDKKRELNIPDQAYSKLKKMYELNSAKNTLALEEFGIVARSLKDAGIQFILLQEASLLHTIFQDSIAIRKMEDIDILVKGEDARKAVRVLAASGYRPELILGPHSGSRDTSKTNSEIYYKEGGKQGTPYANIHLHWHIQDPIMGSVKQDLSRIKMTDIWDASASLGMDGTGNIFIMSPEHMLVVLSAQGMRRGFPTLDILYDIHAYATRYKHTLDWQKLINLARDWSLVVPLRTGLSLSNWAFKTFIPDYFYKELKIKHVSVFEKIFIDHVRKASIPSKDASVLLYLAVNRRLRDRFKILSGAIRTRLSNKAH